MLSLYLVPTRPHSLPPPTQQIETAWVNRRLPTCVCSIQLERHAGPQPFSADAPTDTNQTTTNTQTNDENPIQSPRLLWLAANPQGGEEATCRKSGGKADVGFQSIKVLVILNSEGAETADPNVDPLSPVCCMFDSCTGPSELVTLQQ